jgi:hypothetical protein
VRLRIVTLAERPRALAALQRIQRAVWPRGMAYINEDAVCGRLWPSLIRHFPEFQLVLCDARGRVVAGGYTIPFAWDGRTATLPMGVDGVLTRGVRALVAPVRPTLKHRYPLTSMARYTRWRRPDGAPLDPWLRVHWRLGARVLGVAARSMVVDGRVREWEAWTGMRFPASGDYVVPGALTTVPIDRARDRGRDVEPNVWMLHPLGGARRR